MKNTIFSLFFLNLGPQRKYGRNREIECTHTATTRCNCGVQEYEERRMFIMGCGVNDTVKPRNEKIEHSCPILLKSVTGNIKF